MAIRSVSSKFISRYHVLKHHKSFPFLENFCFLHRGVRQISYMKNYLGFVLGKAEKTDSLLCKTREVENKIPSKA